MVVAAVAVQPFAPVTVTVYVPGKVILKFAFVPITVVPLLHEYDTPPVAFKVRAALVQDNMVVLGLLEILALGAVIF
jgi:hypothetical protein